MNEIQLRQLGAFNGFKAASPFRRSRGQDARAPRGGGKPSGCGRFAEVLRLVAAGAITYLLVQLAEGCFAGKVEFKGENIKTWPLLTIDEIRDGSATVATDTNTNQTKED